MRRGRSAGLTMSHRRYVDTSLNNPVTKQREREEAKMVENFGDMQKLGKVNLDASMKLFGAFSKSTQALAAEMSEYSKRSFEDGSKTMEKLLGAKTLEQAIEIQTNFAKTAYEGFVAEATKIGELYLDLAKEACKPFESAISKTAPIASASRAPMPR